MQWLLWVVRGESLVTQIMLETFTQLAIYHNPGANDEQLLRAHWRPH